MQISSKNDTLVEQIWIRDKNLMIVFFTELEMKNEF